MRSSFGIAVFVSACTVVLAGIAVIAGGCTVLTNDSLPDDAGKYDGPTDSATPVCATCLANECTGQWAACLTDPACAALAQCAANGSACVCTAGDAGGDAGDADAFATIDARLVHLAYASCNGAKAGTGAACATDCAGTKVSSSDPCNAGDGGATDSGTNDAGSDGATADAATDDGGDAGIADAASDATDAGTTPGAVTVDGCTSCISGKCGDAKKACAIGSECAAYFECAYAAADAAALDECGRQHATGKTAAVELANCTRVACSDACGF